MIPPSLRAHLPADDMRARVALDDIFHRTVNLHQPVAHVAERHGIDPTVVRTVARGWHPRRGWSNLP